MTLRQWRQRGERARLHTQLIVIALAVSLLAAAVELW